MRTLRTLFCILSLSTIAILAGSGPARAEWVPDGASEFCPPGGCASPKAACDAAMQKWSSLYVKFKRVVDGSETTKVCWFDYFCCGIPKPEKPIGITLQCTAGLTQNGRASYLGCLGPQSDRKTQGESCPTCGNPVTISVGNKYQAFTDFRTQGQNPIAFSRHYNGQALTGTYLGFGWRHDFDRALAPENDDWTAPNWIDAERHTGKFLRFTKSGGVFVPDSDIDASLTQTAGGWEFSDGRGTVEAYDAAGLLLTITRADGFQFTLTYVGGKLDTVADSFGRQIVFGYTAYFGTDFLTSVTAPDGRVYKYAYDSAFGGTPGATDRLFQFIHSDATPADDADNPRATYHYEDTNFPYVLTGITDETGNRFATWAYDGERRATLSKHGAGTTDQATFAYDTVNNINTVTYPFGRQEKYHFATIAGIPKVTKIERLPTANTLGGVIDYLYDAAGYVSQKTEREGNKTTYVRNSRGLATSTTEAKDDLTHERTITRTWHSTLSTPTQIVRPGLTVDITHDSKGNVLTRTETDTTAHSLPYSTNGQTRVWTYTYTYSATNPALLEKLEIDGPRAGAGDTATRDYDTNGNLTKVTNALGHITDITAVDGSGRPLSITDPNGVITNLEYDARARLVKRTVDHGGAEAVTQYTYDDAGQVTRVTLPDGSHLDYAYDDAWRLVEVSNTAGEKIVYTLDDLGKVTKEEAKSATGAIKRLVTREFDELGRLIKTIGAALQTTTYGYNRNDLLTSITDPKTNPTTRSYDALNRLAKITDPLLNDAVYDRDAADNLGAVTDQRVLSTSYVYNGFGDVIRRVSPDTGTTDLVYDSAGNLTQKTDARSVVTNYAYDDLNRRTSKTFPANPAENVTYTYDDTITGGAAIGRLTRIDDSSGSTAFVYGPRGNVTSETRTIGTQVYTTSYGYDAADNLASITYPSGRIVSYLRHSVGRVTAVTTRQNALAAETVLASNIAYLPFGPIASIRFGNGQVATYTHDQDYRITGIQTTDGTTNVQDLTYGRDPNSNITAITDALAAARSQTFDYDVLDRLTDATGDYGDLDYGYDPVGNRTARTVDLGTPEVLTYDTASNRLLSADDGVTTRTLGYIANGNVASDSRDGGLGFVYGDDNRLIQVTDQAAVPAVIADYKHNDLGQRVVKDLGAGQVTHFHYDRSGVLIAESDVTGAVAREYVHLAGLPLAVIEGGFTAGAPTEVIQDNGEASTSSTGTWTTTSDWTGYYGPDYADSVGGDGTGAYSWTPNVPSTGVWQVFTRWPSNADEGSSATYTVTHGDGTTQATVDQKSGGGAWKLFGAFPLASGAGHGVALSDKADPPSGARPGSFEVVVDNTDAGATASGAWLASAWTGGGTFWGPDFNYIDTGAPSISFTWTPTLDTSTTYAVYARWSAASDRSTQARYTVHHAAGSTAVIVDQRSNGGTWNLLGTFDLRPGYGHRVVLTDDTPGGARMAADSIRVVRTDIDPQVVDNTDAGFSLSGSWSTSSWTGGGTYLGWNFRYTDTAGTGAKTATWSLPVAQAATYHVYARWSHASDRSSVATYTVHHDAGATPVVVDQRANGGTWNLLGIFDLAPGQSHRVVLHDATPGGARMVADSVMIMRGPATGVIVDNHDAGFALTGSWTTSGWTGAGMFQGPNVVYRSSTGAESATWTPALPTAGTYNVYAWWTPFGNRSPFAVYTVHHAAGATPVTVDQRYSGNAWVYLGTFDLAPGQSHRAVLTDGTPGFGTTLLADAVMFLKTESLPRRVAADAVRLVANDAEAAAITYVHADHLGTPQKMTGATGAVVWDAAYTPFGRAHSITGTAANNIRFPGQYADAESGLSYNYYRDYDPSTGRYVQSDPIGLRGGVNTYAYVFANPLRFEDQFGLVPTCPPEPLGQYDHEPYRDPFPVQVGNPRILDTWWDIIPLGPQVGPSPGWIPLGVDILFKVRRNHLVKYTYRDYVIVDTYETTLYHCWEKRKCEPFWEDTIVINEFVGRRREFDPTTYSVTKREYGDWYIVPLPIPLPFPNM